MKNEELINKYVNNTTNSLKTFNLRCINNILYSYNEPISWFDEGTQTFYLTTMYFSKTTNKHYNLLKKELNYYNKRFKEVCRLSADFKTNSNFNKCRFNT